jgi:hypothetical protein
LALCLDWQPAPGRLADLVEALIGAAWLSSPASALQVAGILVHPGLTLDAVVPESVPLRACSGLQRQAQLGSALLEAGDALLLLDEMPDATEGELSIQRGYDLSARHLVRQVDTLGLSEGCRATREHALDHIQAAVGHVGATQGLLSGLGLAARLLRPAEV